MIRLRRRFLILAVLVGMLCAGYESQWPVYMGSVYNVKAHLKQQDASQWLSALYHQAKFFPVRQSLGTKKGYTYDDGYGEARSYGGNRVHEGIDIMSVQNKRHVLKIQSVSDGVVENIGWLQLGGYRIGIRNKTGLYFYYAHMDSYATGLKKGSRVCAGQFLGYMGDTGYGEEGTKGQFPVHLHFGIYVSEQGEERSLNPYYLLQYLECDMIGRL